MIVNIPDYRYKQLAEALNAYGFSLNDSHYSLQEYVSATPDKFFYFFANKTSSDEVLVLLIEDYISDLDYISNCFNQELDSELVMLHEVKQSKGSSGLEERSPVETAALNQPPVKWAELQPYAVDFPPFYFGFLATVRPHHPKQFWDELHERLEQL